MMEKKHLIRYGIILIYCLLPMCVHGQRIVHVGVDSVTCFGDSVEIRVGYAWGNEIVVANPEPTASHLGRVFLPDGQPCGEMGCSYRSVATFGGFDSTATITSANDINYVRLNIEHSWIGDIYINITCPNGQQASLMNFSNGGTSTCIGSIPASHRFWLSGTNAPTNTFFGNAEDREGAPCDSSAYGNQPGVGWNYCWSENTVNGYTYADGDGIIYRASHVHNGRVDSSDVAGGTNFYHPDESFDSLIGCPLNGNWYIEVMDGWNMDNGYIFDWEISLNDSLNPQIYDIDSVYIIGNEATRTSDSSFLVSAPAGTIGDTTVDYQVIIRTLSGAQLDTVVTVRYSAAPRILLQQRLCEGDTFWVDTMAVTSTLIGEDTLYNAAGCAILTDYDIVFMPNYELYDSMFFCGHEKNIAWNDQVFPTLGDYTLNLQTVVAGCDSIWHVSLSWPDSGFAARPLISDDGNQWYSDTMLAGCRPMTVWVSEQCPFGAHSWWNMGDDSSWYTSDSMTHIYDSVGIFTITYIAESEHGCRDTAVLTNAVWVYGRPVAAFWWSPEYPTMSHPTTEFRNQSTPYTEGSFGGLQPLSYVWTLQTTAGYDSIIGENPVYTWSQENGYVFGDFTVLLTATQPYTDPYGGIVECEDTVQATITILNDWLQFPNLVTPNGDGTNDIWKVVNLLQSDWRSSNGDGTLTLYPMNELWIYNKWGTLVFHAKDIDEEEDFWDPNETHSPDGTYYFRFSAESLFGVVRRNGLIEVVR